MIAIYEAESAMEYAAAEMILRAAWPGGYVSDAIEALSPARDAADGTRRFIAEIDGLPVGTVALVPWPGAPQVVAEWAQGAVLPDYAKQGVFAALLDTLDAASKAGGFSFVFGSSVTYSTSSQRALLAHGLQPLGYELGLCPPDMGGTPQPWPTVLQGKFIAPRTGAPRFNRVAVKSCVVTACCGDNIMRTLDEMDAETTGLMERLSEGAMVSQQVWLPQGFPINIAKQQLVKRGFRMTLARSAPMGWLLQRPVNWAPEWSDAIKTAPAFDSVRESMRIDYRQWKMMEASK